ncbi:SDR family oxidoreductase [Dongia deserti]|uniref:SDR family oxidoreductase n=1 Tax=Dongia deserti TaxID=2268030 RepID=UPI000E659AD4|nr:SDR family oxidoreductase [Dongia deserti]
MKPHLFCFGLGYSATYLARQLIAKGWQVTGTCRSRDHQIELSRLGIEAHLFDRDHRIGSLPELLSRATHLLSSVPPDEKGDPVLDMHRTEIDAAAPRLAWIGYLSTTGVYGNRDGGWVDEMSELAPTGERGRRRVAAERGWLALSQPAHLFRLAGIYGPGSSALDTVREGRAKRIVKPGQIFSRIHVADIAQVLEASMARPHPGAAYNVCDDDPAPPSDVIAFAAALLNRPSPPEIPIEQAELSPMARSFYDDNKRVSNSRIKRELGVALHYPSYRVGLPAILGAGG